MASAAIAELFYQLSNAPQLPSGANDNARAASLLQSYLDRLLSIHIAATLEWKAEAERTLDRLDADLQSLPQEQALDEGEELWALVSEALRMIIEERGLVENARRQLEAPPSDDGGQTVLQAIVKSRIPDAEAAGRVMLEARAEMHFRILALAEKYAPRSRSDSIAASVERSLASYPVVNDILAR